MPPTFTIVEGAPMTAEPVRRLHRKRPAYQALIRMSDRRLADRGLVRVAMAGVLVLAPCGMVQPAPPRLHRPCNENRPVHLC